ncbi:D-alanyl-lipoteichoic acid biosynthesis protein DltD [Lactococcus nasutitermitis]|uniref:Protein DltD n=1 Tax=Lactococcus nasutitermitis TaxID=1652957 RepID=A0ABV9JG07_9LACT|nr:D-alanyl-lipoteichoic acid biosynthesis protein DltD [Lactococcus nasutitermitis]
MKNFFQKHKILKEVLPLFVALLLVGILFLSPLAVMRKYSQKQLMAFANNPKSRTEFVGYSIKEQAFSNYGFLPILGSSELEHVDAFHPSVYADKYNKAWTPFLAGQPGTQSLTQFFYVNSVAQQLHGRKIVFIISPQWFKPQGIPVPALENFVSKGEVYSWLLSAKSGNFATQQLAARLQRTPDFDDDLLIGSCLKTLSQNKALNAAQRTAVFAAQEFWKKEDLLFSAFSTKMEGADAKLAKVHKYAKQLPAHPTPAELNQRAYDLGEKAANNNPWGINNKLWTKYKGLLMSEKGSYARVSYLSSPEYGDFQQLLNQFAANDNQVLFVIQPVNGKWYRDYAGLPYERLREFSSKIKEQLNAQGFNHVLDLTDKYYEPYYSGDTIHFGTRGWLAVDRGIDKFMKTSHATNYHLDNKKFLSVNWQMNTK